MKKVLIIVDKLGWSYDTIAKGILKYNTKDDLFFDIFSVKDGLGDIEENHTKYDLIFAMGWTLIITQEKKKNYKKLLNRKKLITGIHSHRSWDCEELAFLDRKKLITGIHSHRSWDGYLSLPDESPLPPKELLSRLACVKNINIISRRLYKIFEDAGLSNIVLTENGVDTELFCPINSINTSRTVPLIIGFSGSKEHPFHDYLKGVSEFISPLKNIPNVEVKILGGKGEQQVTREDMPELYNQIDLYICASSSEGFSQSVLEASSCGRGIISTKVGGCEDLIEEHRNGFFIKRDLGEIKKLVRKLEADRHLVKKLGGNNREIVQEKYSWKVKVQAWLRFIESNLP